MKFNLQIWQILLLPALAALLLTLPAGAQTPEPPASIFNDAAAEFGVPRDLLAALGYTRSHLRNQISELDEFGVMQLPPEQVAAAAALLGVPVDAIRFDTRQNVRGAAALLRQTADRLYPAQSTLSAEQWFVVTAAFSFPGNPTQGREHARQVFSVLANGLAVQAGGETLTIAPWPEARPLAAQPVVRIASDDYAPAHWVAAHDSNFTAAARTAGDIDMIIIHTTEANYSAVLNYFAQPERWSSAHYVIRSADGDVSQMVRDSDVAWHAGHWQTNLRSIGIEHEAFVDDASWYTDEMYRASAQLVRHLAAKYAIPLDRQHIIGHGEVPGCPFTGGGASCHTDPGPHWDWDYFFQLLQVENATPTPTPTPTLTPTPDTQNTGNLIGLVTHAQTGERLPGAVVSAAGQTVQANPQGVYILKGLPAGSVPVTVELAGFAPAAKTGVVQAGTTRWNSVQLEPLPAGDSTPTATATPTETPTPPGTPTPLPTGTPAPPSPAPPSPTPPSPTPPSPTPPSPTPLPATPTPTLPAPTPTPAAPTGSLVGLVQDAASGQRLAGVTVSAAGRQFVTDERGYYRFDGLAAGAQTVIAEHPNYATTQKTGEVVAGQVRWNSIQLAAP